MVDAGDYEGGVNLFTEDAVWTLWGQELNGRAEIKKGLEDGLGPGFIRLSLPFIPSIAETLEFCITTGYPFRHA